MVTKDSLKDFVVGMKELGMSPGGCNSYIRSFNSFLTWLHENGHTEPLKIKQLPKPQTVIKVFSEKHVQALIKFRPKDKYEWRLYALICLLTDTGIRIDECLTCLVSNVNLDNLIIKVRVRVIRKGWFLSQWRCGRSYGSTSTVTVSKCRLTTCSLLVDGHKLDYKQHPTGYKSALWATRYLRCENVSKLIQAILCGQLRSAGRGYFQTVENTRPQQLVCDSALLALYGC